MDRPGEADSSGAHVSCRPPISPWRMADEAILRIQLGVVRTAIRKAWQTIDPAEHPPPIDLVPCPINFFVQNRCDWHSSMGLKVFLKPPPGADGKAMVGTLRVELGLRPPFVMYQVHLGGME